jgi:hypothetical protein
MSKLPKYGCVIFCSFSTFHNITRSHRFEIPCNDVVVDADQLTNSALFHSFSSLFPDAFINTDAPFRVKGDAVRHIGRKTAHHYETQYIIAVQ